MDLDITLTSSDDTQLALSEEEIRHILETVLGEFNLDGSYSISVSFVSNDEISDLNSEWRGVAHPTDVLSFECDNPFDDEVFEGEPCVIGDIVLAPEYISHQAIDFNTTPADETRLLLIHGGLHLLGYDHEEDDEFRSMIQLEQSLLDKLVTDGTITEHVLVKHHEEA